MAQDTSIQFGQDPPLFSKPPGWVPPAAAQRPQDTFQAHNPIHRCFSSPCQFLTRLQCPVVAYGAESPYPPDVKALAEAWACVTEGLGMSKSTDMLATGCLCRFLCKSCHGLPTVPQLHWNMSILLILLLSLPCSPANAHTALQPGSIWGGAVAAQGGGRPTQQSPPHTPPPAAAQPENLEVLHLQQGWALCLELCAIASCRKSVARITSLLRALMGICQGGWPQPCGDRRISRQLRDALC